jgi:hypothetical protein
MGHSAYFGYALWAIMQDSFMRSEPWRQTNYHGAEQHNIILKDCPWYL